MKEEHEDSSDAKAETLAGGGRRACAGGILCKIFIVLLSGKSIIVKTFSSVTVI